MKKLTFYGKLCLLSSVIFFVLGLALVVHRLITGQFINLTLLIVFISLAMVFAGNLFLYKEASFMKYKDDAP